MRFDTYGYPLWPGQPGFASENDYMPEPRPRRRYDEHVSVEHWPLNWCFACGRSPLLVDVPDRWFGSWQLELAHLSAGSGRGFRRLDRRAVILLCSRCHSLHTHHPSIRLLASEDVPTLTDSAAIWLKRERDPDYYDEAFIREMWLGNVPEPQPPADWYLEQYRHFHP